MIVGSVSVDKVQQNFGDDEDFPSLAHLLSMNFLKRFFDAVLYGVSRWTLSTHHLRLASIVGTEV